MLYLPVPTLTLLNRNAFAMTETDDSDIAAAAKTGLRSSPDTGYRSPAAMGTPAAL